MAIQHSDRLSDEERVERRKASAARYREKNREKCNEATKRCQANNPQKVKATRDAYKAKNRDEIRKKWREYAAKNKERNKANSYKWRDENPEKYSSYLKEYYAITRDTAIARKKAWDLANRVRSRNYSRVYLQNNLIGKRIRELNRRARKKQSGGVLSKDIAARLMVEQNCKCNYCKTDLKISGYHLDHIMPLALGGSNGDENIQLLCAPCNLSKGAKHPDEFMQRVGSTAISVAA